MSGFDWDQANSDHLARHNVSPREAEEVVLNEPIDLDYYTRHDEDRTEADR